MESMNSFDPFHLLFANVVKIFLDNFRLNFRNFIIPGSLSRDYYWSGGMDEIYDFRGFLRISQLVFDISS